MAKFQSNQIRNICLIGHGGDGKTSLAEAMLYVAKVTDRLGKIADGNTVCDFDPDEVKKQGSLSSSLVNLVWNDKKINILDTPGDFDFVGEVKQAVSVAGSAIIVVDGKTGLKVGAELAWDHAEKIPKAFFVNKMDDENAKFSKVVSQLRDTFGNTICPMFVPFHEGTPNLGYVNVITGQAFKFDKNGNRSDAEIPADFVSELENYTLQVNEALAVTSDELMEKFFAGEAFTKEEMSVALNKGLFEGSIVPVFSGSATNLSGVRTLLDIIASSFVSPVDRAVTSAVDASGNSCTYTADQNGETALFVFKTVADSFGKKTFFKVVNGTVRKDDMLTNKKTGGAEKIARIVTCVGKSETDADELAYGDLGCTVKLVNTNTGDTLSTNSFEYTIPRIDFPVPYLCKAIIPKAKGDEDKISTGVAKLLEEDLTARYENNAETKQMCLYGLGDTHIDMLVSKLKTRFGTSVETQTPRVAYRETIKKKAQVEGKHKKQSGGHGQYGHVKIEFAPGEKEELEFSESVFGGAVPKNFFPAVEKGLQESMAKGILAGYPVIKVKANLFDGSYHPVDSSEMSFKIAANLAFKEGMKACSPTLLEPVGELKVLIPTSFSGDIMSDVSKRRGRVMGMSESSKKGYTVIDAEVPSAEMLSYAVQLRAMTQGRGSYTFDFVRYEEAPAEIAAKVIETAKKDNADGE